MAQAINIQFTRFSAFYSPLIATIAGGFLQEEGLEPRHSVAPVGKIRDRRTGRRQRAGGAVGALAGFHPARKRAAAAGAAFRPDQRKRRLLHHRAQARSEFHLGQAQVRQDTGRSWRAAARDVQVCVPEEGTGLEIAVHRGRRHGDHGPGIPRRHAATTFTSRGRRRSSSNMTVSATWSLRWAMRSARSRFPAWRRRASGSRPTRRSASRAPTARRAPG